MASERTRCEELLAQKNAAVRKAESLQHDLSKKLAFTSVSAEGLTVHDYVMMSRGFAVLSQSSFTPERFEELERQNDFLSQQLVLLTAEKNKLKSEFVSDTSR